MVILQNIWWLLVLLGIMILIHELGHFWAAKYFDVRVDTFSFGFGPRLFGFRRGETDFRFSAILFGGYVKMAGEQPGDQSATDPRAFLSKPRWQRLVIAFAGPFMNIILAVALLAGLFMYKYPKPMPPDLAGVVSYVQADSPAAKAGVKAGDRIARIADIDNPTWEQIALKVLMNARQPLSVTLFRDGKTIQTTVTPKLMEQAGVGFAGWSQPAETQIAAVWGDPAKNAGLRAGDLLVSANGQPIRSFQKLQEVTAGSGGKPVDIVIEREGLRQQVRVEPAVMKVDGPERWMIGISIEPRITYVRLGPFEAVYQSIHHNVRGATLIYQFLRGIIERKMSAKSLDGPIRIAQLSGEAARDGVDTFIWLMATVSLNLAIINLLPIPILDGGVIVMLLVEMLIRRDLSLRVKETFFKLGFALLMAVMVFVLYNDLTKILTSG